MVLGDNYGSVCYGVSVIGVRGPGRAVAAGSFYFYFYFFFISAAVQRINGGVLLDTYSIKTRQRDDSIAAAESGSVHEAGPPGLCLTSPEIYGALARWSAWVVGQWDADWPAGDNAGVRLERWSH